MIAGIRDLTMSKLMHAFASDAGSTLQEILTSVTCDFSHKTMSSYCITREGPRKDSDIASDQFFFLIPRTVLKLMNDSELEKEREEEGEEGMNLCFGTRYDGGYESVDVVIDEVVLKKFDA